MKDKSMLGIMIDCSRNAVMKIDELKKYVLLLSKMGYNTLMLYMEDTYEVTNEPLFGYMRGRYTKEEIKNLDAYCVDNGIELIPCIQSLAHLNALFRWTEYKKICDFNDILLIDNDRTYQLIDNMFSSLSECFSSKQIHIGMDEAHMVGLGKYLDEHGFCDRLDLLSYHLNKVCGIAEQYGLKPMMWSDMFYRLANKGNYYDVDSPKNEEIASKTPKNLSLVYWDYYRDDKESYLKMIQDHKKIVDHVIFAGGAWSWVGFAPNNSLSISRTEKALRACKEQGVKDVFLTMWGDDGAECSRYAVLPTLMVAAEMYRDNYDIESIKVKFKEIVGSDFDSFLLLDGACSAVEGYGYGDSKMKLYNDLFCGINDYFCSEKDKEYYRELCDKILSAPQKGEYAYLFDTIAFLCDVLSIKSSLGVELRKAYQAKDKDELKRLSDKIKVFEEKLLLFYNAFKAQWMKDNKPYGFDIHDMRLGGLLQRAKSCNERIVQYLDGTIDSIPELDEVIIEAVHVGGHCWETTVSANVVSPYQP